MRSVTVHPLAAARPHAPASLRAGSDRLTGAAYRAIVERARDIFSLIDGQGRLHYQSPAFFRSFGYAPEEVIGHDVLSFLHPDDRALSTSVLQGLLSGAQAQAQVTVRFRHADGTWRWIECSLSNEFADPSIGAILAISREVTDLRRLSAQLSQVEGVGKLGHWRWSVGDRGPYWSDGMFRLGGLEPRSFDPVNWKRQIHPDDVGHMVDTHRKAVETGRPFDYQTRLRHSDGTYRTIQTQGHAEIDAAGKVSALLCVCQDLTERVAAENAVRASEEQYRLLAANASDIIARFRPDVGLVFVSPAVSRVLGYDPEPLMGFGFGALFYGPSDYQQFLQQIEIAANREAPVTVTSRVRHRNGSLMWIESSIHSVADYRTGRMMELVLISRDVTERKRHELDLLTARDAAETANRTKSLFLANMSHELRTPLNAIIGFSEVLKDEMFGALGSPRYLEYAQDIHESGEHLLELINDILDMSKIEAGKYALHFEELDLEDVIETSIRLMHLRAQEAGVSVDRMLGIEAAKVTADRRAVKQILLNLLSNAIKFTPSGGRVMVGIEWDGERVLLRVTDTGIGIAEEHLPRLGQPFEQVDAADAKGSGTGLGLALVKALAELHGGTLRIDSRLGTGTIVTVDLPVSQAGPA